MSDANPKQTKWQVHTTTGIVHVDADSADEAAMIARGHSGGTVFDITEMKAADAKAENKASTKAATAAASASESELADTLAPAEGVPA